MKGLDDVMSLSAGATDSICAVRAAGLVQCWGGASSCQFGRPPCGRRLRFDHPVRIPGLRDVVEVSVGANSSCALVETGEVLCWGSGTYGQLGIELDGSTAEPVQVPGFP